MIFMPSFMPWMKDSFSAMLVISLIQSLYFSKMTFCSFESVGTSFSSLRIERFMSFEYSLPRFMYLFAGSMFPKYKFSKVVIKNLLSGCSIYHSKRRKSQVAFYNIMLFSLHFFILFGKLKEVCKSLSQNVI